MAVPFYIPDQGNEQANNQVMTQLLVDLLRVLRQIALIQRPADAQHEPQASARNRPGRRDQADTGQQPGVAAPAPGAGEAVAAPEVPLPDLVLCSMGDATPPPLPPRQRRAAATPGSTPTHDDDAATVPSSGQRRPLPRVPRAPRRRRPRPRRPSEVDDAKPTPAPEGTPTRQQQEDWVRVGEDLRRVADEFQASLKVGG